MSARLSAWGRTPTVAQMKQALIPAGADVLINPVGSAPGFSLRWKGSFIAVLPGVPREAEAMFEAGVAPHFHLGYTAIKSNSVSCTHSGCSSPISIGSSALS